VSGGSPAGPIPVQAAVQEQVQAVVQDNCLIISLGARGASSALRLPSASSDVNKGENIWPLQKNALLLQQT